MANYIITKNRKFFENIGNYTYAFLDNMTLPETIAVDTETTSLSPKDGYIFAIQIGTGKDNYLIDLQKHSDESLRYTLEEVMPYFIDRKMVFHNAAFDLSFFFTAGYFIKNVFDTMLASMIYYNGASYIRHSFKECMEREMEIYYDKTEQANIATVQLSQPSTIKYCFNDVDKLLDLHNKYIDLLTEYEAIETYLLHCKHIRALTYMELCGLPLSKEKWQNKMDNDYKKYKEAERIVMEYIFDNLPKYRQNQLDMFDSSKKVTCLLSSSKQMIPVFKDFGINVEVVDKHEVKESLDKSVLSKSSHPFVKLWFNFKESEHNVTTFGEGILNKIEDGRIYTKFKPILDTARIASRKGEINFLNFPAQKETRECFEANEGFKVIVADYEGQETVVGADITGDEAMIQSIVDGLDLHCAFARVLYPELENLSDDEIKKDHKSKRNASKAPRFCFQFGGTGYTLAMNEGMSVEEGMRIEKLFKQLHSGIYAYGENKLEESIELGYIEYAYGFKLRLPFYDKFQPLHEFIKNLPSHFWEAYRIGKKEYVANKMAKEAGDLYRIMDYPSYNLYVENKNRISEYFSRKSEYFRLCLNAPTQGTAAHQTKYATVLLFEEIEKNNHYWKARIANVIHDEIFLEVEEELVPQYLKVLENSMIKGGNAFLTNPILKMKADANAEKNWALAK